MFGVGSLEVAWHGDYFRLNTSVAVTRVDGSGEAVARERDRGALFLFPEFYGKGKIEFTFFF